MRILLREKIDKIAFQSGEVCRIKCTRQEQTLFIRDHNCFIYIYFRFYRRNYERIDMLLNERSSLQCLNRFLVSTEKINGTLSDIYLLVMKFFDFIIAPIVGFICHFDCC